MWVKTMSFQGNWQLPQHDDDVLLRIGDSYFVGYLVDPPRGNDVDDGAYFNVVSPLDETPYSLDDVDSWCSFIKPVTQK